MADYIGPYRLLRKLMTGQTSEIFEAIDDRKGERYALKCLLPSHRKNREDIAALKTEYEVGNSLDHPNCISMVEVFYVKGAPNVVMELFLYPNLKQQLTASGRDELAPRALTIMQQGCDALQHCHKQGWIHRDIKPDNFLADEEGSVRLIDFALSQKRKTGLAKMFAGKSKIAGTASYMSPEQIRGEVLDFGSDIYSLGCTYFELLTGKTPFVGLNTNELLQRHLSAAPPNAQTVNDNITPEMARLLMNMMAKKPSDRPETVGRLLIELKSIRVFKQDPRPQVKAS